jgi:hypothetical protein
LKAEDILKAEDNMKAEDLIKKIKKGKPNHFNPCR